MSQDIVSRLIDLDSRAEAARAKAREEAEAIRKETERLAGEARAELAERIAAGAAEVEAREGEKRKGEVAAIEAEFAARAEAVRAVKQDAIERAVRAIVETAKGATG